MNSPLVFNHHALPYPSAAQAEDDLPGFVTTTYQCFKKYNFQLILLDESLDKSWYNIQLAPGYFWRDWLAIAKQDSALRDIRRAFLSLVTAQPLLALDTKSAGEGVEVGLLGNDQGLNTLQAVYVYQTYLLSLPTQTPWNQVQIDVWVEQLDETGVVSRAEIRLNNLCNSASLAHHKPALQHLNANQLSGKMLWEQRASRFPHVTLLPELQGALCNNSYPPAMLEKIRQTLIALNQFAESWQAGTYKAYQHDLLAECGLSIAVSGESTSTLQDPKKRAAREFWLPKGDKVCFANHVKLAPNLRLHFYPEPIEKTVYIGYVGPHLPV